MTCTRSCSPRTGPALQRAHATWLHARGGHYLFTVKGNQPTLRRALAGLPWAQVPRSRRRQVAHGRAESRSVKVIDLAGHPAAALFPHATRAIKVVRRRRAQRTGKTSTEIVYAVTSLTYRQADPGLLATWIQGHWGIENRVHHVRDVTQGEDASRIRTGTGPEVMAIQRNTALNLHRLDGHTNIASAQPQAAGTPATATPPSPQPDHQPSGQVNPRICGLCLDPATWGEATPDRTRVLHICSVQQSR